MLDMVVSNFRGKVLIPETVMTEVCEDRRIEVPAIEKLINDHKIEVFKVKGIAQTKNIMEDFSIDRGEAEAIILSIEKGISMVATDDRNAIRACKMLKLDFVTAITILIRAFEKTLIDSETALLKLQKLQLIGRYSKEIIRDATKLLRGGT